MKSLKEIYLNITENAGYYDARGMTLEQVFEKWVKDQNKAYDGLFMQPTLDVWKYREYTWYRNTSRSGHARVNGRLVVLWGPLKWDATKEDMKVNGWDRENPGHMSFGKNGVMKLGEGNHRLAIAKEIGIKEVPLQYHFYSKVDKNPQHNNHDEYSPPNIDLNTIRQVLNKMPPKEKWDAISMSELEIALGIAQPKEVKPQSTTVEPKVEPKYPDDIDQILKLLL